MPPRIFFYRGFLLFFRFFSPTVLQLIVCGVLEFFFFQGCINFGVVEVQVCIDGTKVRNN